MRKICLGFIISFAVLVGCNEGKKSRNSASTDTIVVVTPENIDEQNQLSEVITRFVRAYASKDNEKANALIHPDLGINIIYRPGAADVFVAKDSLDFSNPVPEVFAYPDLIMDYSLIYDKLPSFDCGTLKWDKLGFFCDTTSHPNQLSNIAAFEEEFNDKSISEDDLINLEIAEKESYRVIVTTEDPLIFHVRKYKGVWYVTTLDRAYGGCDA